MRFLLLLLLLTAVIPAASIGEVAIPPVDLERYPTVALLDQTEQPPADFADLARRFRGLRDALIQAAEPPQFTPGDRKTFFVSVATSGGTTTTEAELLAIGEHVLVWADVDAAVPPQDAQAFADRFTADVYLPTRALWGSEASPGIDGDSRLYVLFTSRVSRGIAAYYSGQNSLPAAVQPVSNQHEMMVFNLSSLPDPISDDAVMSTASHEFQHMINHHQDQNEESWLDEGFSMFTQYWLALGEVDWSLQSFISHPENQLNLWGLEEHRGADYGGALLFLVYLYEQHGLELLQQINAHPLDGMRAVDAVLQASGQGGVDILFADWVVANALQLADGRYGYRTLPDLPAIQSAPVDSLPYGRNQRMQQYATEYYSLNALPASGSLQVRVILPEDAGLIPFAPPVGARVWYSGRGDDANPRLTRSFDLRGVDSAELSYAIWYALEQDWDYGYLSISADGGQTWQIQSTPLTTDRNPNYKAYGAGYNGRSAGWQQERVSLDAYAGQQILVRFEVVTDDATNEAGMALDDLRLDAIGYAADFEQDDGGWQSDGWLLTDNRLPQRAWLQLAQQVGEEVQLTRWLLQGSDSFDLTLDPDAQRTFLMISPFAPVTGESLIYSLQITGD